MKVKNHTKRKIFWGRELRHQGARGQPLYVLVCLHGVNVSLGRFLGIESQHLARSALFSGLIYVRQTPETRA